MKRKNLILSLICSILVAVTMISFTVYSLVAPASKNNQNIGGTGSNVSIGGENVVDPGDEIVIDENINELRDGSEELPYVLYNAENFVSMLSEYGSKTQEKKTFVKEPVMVDDGNGALVPKFDENGEQVYQNKVDEDGNLVFEFVLDEDGNKIYVPYYFELGKNIDFAGVDYIPLFNDGTAFSGVINGNGFKLKNIAVNVNADNFKSEFTYKNEKQNLVSHVALFGDMNGAVVKDLTIEAMQVNVDKAVCENIENGVYSDGSSFLTEVAVGSIAGVAVDTKVENVTVDSKINAFAYALYTFNANDELVPIGYNAIGGLFAAAQNVEVEKSTVDVEIVTNAGYRYYVAGVAAYATEVDVKDSRIETTIQDNISKEVASKQQRLTVAGMFVVAETINVENTNVEFSVKEVAASAEKRAEYYTALGTTAHNNSLGKAAGITVFLTADSDANKSTFKNVSIVADVDYDCVYAGVIVDVLNTKDKTNKELVKLENVIVDSNVNVLIAYGYGRQIIGATVAFDETQTGANITLTGKTNLSKYKVTSTVYQNYSATLFTYHRSRENCITFSNKALNFKISSTIYAGLGMSDLDGVRFNWFGSVEY